MKRTQTKRTQMIKQLTVKMKIIHYSRTGYNGDYTYTSVCGKEVKTHQTDEECSIYPEDANCEKCLQSEKQKIDLLDSSTINPAIKRRIYLESDILQAGEFRRACREVKHFLNDSGSAHVDRVFSVVIDHAWHNLEQTWDAVKNADEIYATSSFIPLCGGYTGAPVIFNGMCERAIKEGVIGKSVIILNTFDNVSWDYIDIPKMKKAFKENTLFMYDSDYEHLIKVDVAKITSK